MESHATQEDPDPGEPSTTTLLPVSLSPTDHAFLLHICRHLLTDFYPLPKLVLDYNAQLSTVKKGRLPKGVVNLDGNIPVSLHRHELRTNYESFTENFVKPYLYEDALASIRKQIENHKLWLVLSTFSNGFEEQFVAVILGTLGETKKVFLINCKRTMKETDESEEKAFYLDLFEESMNLLWPNAPNTWTDHLKLLVTELKLGMAEAALELKASSPTLIHLSCLEQCLHQLETFIVNPPDDFDLPTPPYFDLYHDILVEMHSFINEIGQETFCSHSGLPPLPVESLEVEDFLLQWIDYVHANFEGLKEYFIEQDDYCDEEEQEEMFLQKALLDPGTKRKLATLKVKYAPLKSTLALLRSADKGIPIPLVLILTSIEELRLKLSKWPDSFEKLMTYKLTEMLAHNSGYLELLQLATTSSIDDLAQLANAPTSALRLMQCFPRFVQMLLLYPEYNFKAEYMAIYGLLYCAREQQVRENQIQNPNDEPKPEGYFELDRRNRQYILEPGIHYQRAKLRYPEAKTTD